MKPRSPSDLPKPEFANPKKPTIYPLQTRVDHEPKAVALAGSSNGIVSKSDQHVPQINLSGRRNETEKHNSEAEKGSQHENK